MLSLVLEPKQSNAKMDLKTRETDGKSCQKKGARFPGAWGSRPSDGALPTHWFLASRGPPSRRSAWVPAEETAFRPKFGMSYKLL